MSHFSCVNCKLSNKEVLRRALKMQPEVNDVKDNWIVRGYGRRAVKSDLVAILNGNYDIGFNFRGAETVVVADWSAGTCTESEVYRDKTLEGLWQRIVKTYLELMIKDMHNTNKDKENIHVRVLG